MFPTRPSVRSWPPEKLNCEKVYETKQRSQPGAKCAREATDADRSQGLRIRARSESRSPKIIRLPNDMTTRRKFIASCSTVTLAATVAPGTVLATPTPLKDLSLQQLSLAGF